MSTSRRGGSARLASRCRRAGLLVVALLLAAGQRGGADAQIVSPGKLSRPHASLEGVTSCTRCHQLGQRGPSSQLCLACHELIRTRIAARRGYHAPVSNRPCAECHKEHLGLDFALVRLDSSSFRHGETGHDLRGAHATVGCRDCHTPVRITARDVRVYAARHAGLLRRTWLGLPGDCAGCHRPEDPHGSQFRGRGCEECHDETRWEGASRFDHDRTGYRLTGRHREVECGGCHRAARAGETVRYAGLRYSACTDCHDDPHRGDMGAACGRCHDPSGWERVDVAAVEGVFDHRRTDFPLAGAHERAACSDCHRTPARRDEEIEIRFQRATESRAFPRPIHQDCASCHRDAHDGMFSGLPAAASCRDCHTETAWIPPTFDLARHDRPGGFALTGAHRATPCSGCHTGPDGRFHLPDRECVACHTTDDPHGGRFGGRACDDCHDTDGFEVGTFDHSLVAGGECRSCHEEDDPHGDQFAGRDCAGCHGTESYRIPDFDHAATRFPLDGAHSAAACAACHAEETTPAGRRMVRYRPLGTACRDCHGGGR